MAYQIGRINGPALADNLQRESTDTFAFETDLLVIDGSNGVVSTSGALETSASTTGRAGINIAEGVAPSAPVDGDVWVTSTGEFVAHLNGSSIELSTGGAAAITGRYRFDTSTSTSPGNGRIRFDNGTLGSVTEIFISDTTDAGFDATNFLNSLSAGDRVYIQVERNADEFVVWDVSSAITDEGSWFRIPVTLKSNGSAIGNNDKITMTIIYGAAAPAANPTATTTELEDIADAINTDDVKVAGYMVFNTTTNAPVWSVGDADGSVWNDATGSSAHTPV